MCTGCDSSVYFDSLVFNKQTMPTESQLATYFTKPLLRLGPGDFLPLFMFFRSVLDRTIFRSFRYVFRSVMVTENDNNIVRANGTLD